MEGTAETKNRIPLWVRNGTKESPFTPLEGTLIVFSKRSKMIERDPRSRKGVTYKRFLEGTAETKNMTVLWVQSDPKNRLLAQEPSLDFFSKR